MDFYLADPDPEPALQKTPNCPPRRHNADFLILKTLNIKRKLAHNHKSFSFLTLVRISPFSHSFFSLSLFLPGSSDFSFSFPLFLTYVSLILFLFFALLQVIFLFSSLTLWPVLFSSFCYILSPFMKFTFFPFQSVVLLLKRPSPTSLTFESPNL